MSLRQKKRSPEAGFTAVTSRCATRMATLRSRTGRKTSSSLGVRISQASKSRKGLLGNDLGQMRVGWQFDMNGYVVEPPYRDDNLGLWDFGEEDIPPDTLEAEHTFSSVQIEEQLENDTTPPDTERQETEQDPDAAAAPVKVELQETQGVPVARYPEFDYATGHERPDWTTLLEYIPLAGDPALRRGEPVEKLAVTNNTRRK